MISLGLAPTPNSGSGWIVKEDGQSEHIICQLKSTDALSISVKKNDLDKLMHNSFVSHKIPVFALQFIKSGEVWVMTKPEYLEDISEYIKTGESNSRNFLGIEQIELDDTETCPVEKKKIVSSSRAKKNFKSEMDEKYKKSWRSAK